MEVSLHTEPHLLAGTIIPTVSKRNVTLAIDNGLNLVEWRQRKEQARGQITVYGRRLRVSTLLKCSCLYLLKRECFDMRAFQDHVMH